MKYISLVDAHNALQNCNAVIWNDSMLCFPAVFDLPENGNEEFLSLRTDDDDGQTFETSFIQNENEIVRIDGSTMYLIDSNGDVVNIVLLTPNANLFNQFTNIGLHEII